MSKKLKYRTDARRRYRWQSLFKSVLNNKMNECVAECCICRGWSWRCQATCPAGRIWATPLHPAASVLECLPPRLVKAASSQSAAGSGLLRHCCRPLRNRLTGSPRPPKTLAKRNASSKGLIACFKSNGTKTFFSSNVKNNKSMHVALILTHKGGRGSFMFWTGCQVPQWKKLCQKGHLASHVGAKGCSIFKPAESERWLSAAFASLYVAPDTCHLSVCSYTHTHTLLEAPWAVLIYRSPSIICLPPFALYSGGLAERLSRLQSRQRSAVSFWRHQSLSHAPAATGDPQIYTHALPLSQKHSPAVIVHVWWRSVQEVLAVCWSPTRSWEHNVQVTGNSSSESYCLFFLSVM